MLFFGHFWAYVGQPHGHIGWAKSMPFASINPTNPRTNPWKFHEKILRIGGAGKWGFFEAAILNFLSQPFWIFFCFNISEKPSPFIWGISFFCTIDGFSRILEKKMSELLCTRLYFKLSRSTSNPLRNFLIPLMVIAQKLFPSSLLLYNLEGT